MGSKFKIALALTLSLFASQAYAVSLDNAEVIEGELIAEEIKTNKLKLNSLTVRNTLDTVAAIPLAAIDTSGANTGDIPIVNANVLGFGTVTFNAGGTIFADTPAFADNTILSEDILNSAITEEKLADDSISRSKIIPQAIQGRHIVPGSLGTNELQLPEAIMEKGFNLRFDNQIISSISQSTTIPHALEYLDNQSRVQHPSALTGKLIESSNNSPTVINNGLSFNALARVLGDININGSLIGYNAQSAQSNQASNIAGSGNLNDVFYQEADNLTKKTNSIAYDIKNAMAMDSAANPVPKWKKLKITRERIINTSTTCGSICASRLCASATRSNQPVSCSALASPFDINNPSTTGLIKCDCWEISLSD